MAKINIPHYLLPKKNKTDKKYENDKKYEKWIYSWKAIFFHVLLWFHKEKHTAKQISAKFHADIFSGSTIWMQGENAVEWELEGLVFAPPCVQL